MVCELVSVGKLLIQILTRLGIWVRASQTAEPPRRHPSLLIREIILVVFDAVVFILGVFPLVCTTAFFYVMFLLLFLGIVDIYTMKLDDALSPDGKWSSGEIVNGGICFFIVPSFLPRAFHWGGVTDLRHSLQRQTLNSKLELFHSLFDYRAKSWCKI